MNRFRVWAAIPAVFAGCAGQINNGQVYTLYRNGVGDPTGRYHVATFDATESEAYNHENCERARALFQAQPGIWTHFWCEHGRAN